MQKTFKEMRSEFIRLYNREIKTKLPSYTRMRRREGLAQLSFMGVFCAMVTLVGSVIVGKFALPVLNSFIPSFSFSQTFITLWFGALGALLAVSVFTLLISTSGSTHTIDGVTYIQQDLEMELKNELMPKFINIFFENGFWYKKSNYDFENSEYYNKLANVSNPAEAVKAMVKQGRPKYKIENLRSLCILNPYPWERYDDIIFGDYKDVKIRIYDVNTKIILFSEFMLVLFFTVWLSGITAGLFLYLLILCLSVLLIAALIFSFKIIQYSCFRGAIIEFDMNKNVKGHTFFHSRSLPSKRFFVNHKKYSKVNLESTSFNEKYNVYSTDQIEARYILTPSLMERIENLKLAYKAKYIRGSFKDSKLVIAIHTGKDMFAMGSDFEDSDDETFVQLYNEMISVLQIVDTLKLNEHIGL